MEQKGATLVRDYQRLGVPVDASPAQIKRRYRKLARICHPDRFFGNIQGRLEAEDMMKAINEAYERIRDAPLCNAQPSSSMMNAGAPPRATRAPDAPMQARAPGARLDPATREILIQMLRQPSLMEEIGAGAQKALPFAAVVLILIGSSFGLLRTDWSVAALGCVLALIALALNHAQRLLGYWKRIVHRFKDGA
jgi:hypothetical protein